MRRGGFSLMEFIVGANLLLLVLLGATTMLKPLNQALRKSRALSAMIKVENAIRDGVYLQNSYSDLSKFEIKSPDGSGVVFAKQNKSIFIKEDLTDSSEDPKSGYGIQVRAQMLKSGSNIGVVYQVSPSTAAGFVMTSLGAQEWPADFSDPSVVNQFFDGSNGNGSATSEFIRIPDRLASSLEQSCETVDAGTVTSSGFLRGIRADNTIECWRFSMKKCPAWTIPVGYRLNEDSTIEVLCQKLNQLSCPGMSLALTQGPKAGETVSLPNFYVLDSIVLGDLYPPRPPDALGASSCEPIVDFQIYAADASIPAATVDTHKVDGTSVCPDARLYTKLGDGSCQANFSASAIGPTKAKIVSPPRKSEVAAGDYDIGNRSPGGQQ